MRIPLSVGDYLINGERSVNLYPVIVTDAASGGKYLSFRNTEGLDLFSSISGQPVRGLYVSSTDETKLYAVAGNTFYSVLTNGSATSKGTLNTTSGPVEMSDNGNDGTAKTGIFISDGTYGYTYQPTTDAFAQVADVDFPGAASNCFLDGYTIVVQPGTQKAWSSALYDFSAWSALDFSSAESSPDRLLKVTVTPSGQLAMLGVISTEFFYNASLSAFPFQRIPGARFGYGLAAVNSLALNDQAMFFLARTTMPQGERVIVMVTGYQPTIISTEGIHRLLSSLTNTADAEAFAYMRDGHSFYEITFPSDNVTLVYDGKEGRWHERSSTQGNNEVRHRARGYAYFNGNHIVGDYATGNLYKLRADVHTENGTTIRRKIVTPEFTDRTSGNFIPVPELEVPVKVAVGLDGTGQGTDPLLMLRYSKDGGNTWSNERTASLGKIGEYRKRVRFLRLGQSYRWNFELSVSDPVDIDFQGPMVVPK